MPLGLLASLGAGLISAIVFASATTGPLVPRLILFLITPLPVFMAGLSLGWRSAAIAGAAAAVFLGLAAGPYFALVYAVTQALPAAFLCYLALLHRTLPASHEGAPVVEWYPVGRIVMWAGAIAALLAILMLGMVGTDREALLEIFKTAIGSILKQQPEGGGLPETLGDADLARFATLALTMLPAFSAISWMLGLLGNLWLAGRITLASGRLQRPWPDVASITLPRWAPMALLAATAASTLGGFGGLAATAIAGAAFFAYVLLGLAIAHYATRPFAWRPFALWALYGCIIVLPGAPIFVAILGLAETLRPMRKPANPAPPQSPPNSPPPSPPPPPGG